MEKSRPETIPLGKSVNLQGESPRLKPSEHSVFRRMIGRLMYLTTATRPDIQYAVNTLSQHLAKPCEVHYKAAKHVLRYIRGTVDFCLSYMKHRDSGSRRPKLYGYVDSSHANDRGAKSTSGILFYIDGIDISRRNEDIGNKTPLRPGTNGSSPISWSSRKQPVVAHSSTEAEYIALAEAAKQAIWLRHLLHCLRKNDLYRHKPTPLLEDNQGAIALSDNAVYHPRTKHISVRYHAVREFKDKREISTVYWPTDKMLADGLTKPLGRIQFGRLVEGLRLKGE
ncbi:hypothetical protein VTO42DRAFT_5285 [Malbranchea cinnamomea]